MKNKTNLLKQKEAYLKMKDAENAIALPGEDNCRIKAKKRGGSYAYKSYLKSLKFEQMKKGA